MQSQIEQDSDDISIHMKALDLYSNPIKVQVIDLNTLTRLKIYKKSPMQDPFVFEMRLNSTVLKIFLFDHDKQYKL